jgi:hypothetical protein
MKATDNETKKMKLELHLEQIRLDKSAERSHQPTSACDHMLDLLY